MVWVWSLAVVATLVALALAWRAVARAGAAVASLRTATDGLEALPTSSQALRTEVAASTRQRQALAERAGDPHS